MWWWWGSRGYRHRLTPKLIELADGSSSGQGWRGWWPWAPPYSPPVASRWGGWCREGGGGGVGERGGGGTHPGFGYPLRGVGRNSSKGGRFRC